MKKLHFSHRRFPQKSTWMWLLAISLSGFFTMLAVSGCKKQSEELAPALTAFEQLAKDFTATAALPLSLTSLSLDVAVPPDSLAQLARRVIEEMAFIKTDAAGNVLVHRVQDGYLSAAVIDGYVTSFLAENLIVKGDYLVRFNWKTTSGLAFSTLGTVSADGQPRFEPILHFNGTETVTSIGASDRGQWTWGPWKRTIQNGFGCNCVEVEWTVKIKTSPDGCNIVDPAPHVEITKQLSNCWAWEQRTTQGETMWCNPEQDCQCSVQLSAYGEDCIKWVVVTYVATGFSEVKVEAGVGGEYKGIKVDSKISFETSRFGSEGTFEIIRSLCAKSGSQ